MVSISCVRIVFGKLDVEDVDAGEFLEEAALALHHRLAGERADVAEAEHRGAVGDDGDEVAARRQFVRLGGIVDDRHAGFGDARRIGEREIALRDHRLRRRDRDFSRRRQPVVFERGFPEIAGHRHVPLALAKRQTAANGPAVSPLRSRAFPRLSDEARSTHGPLTALRMTWKPSNCAAAATLRGQRSRRNDAPSPCSTDARPSIAAATRRRSRRHP